MSPYTGHSDRYATVCAAEFGQRLERLLALAETLFPGPPLPRPELRIDLHGRTAGQFRGGPRPVVRLNIELVAHHRAAAAATLGHEVAHLVVHCRWPDARPHGAEWRRVMAGFGLAPERTHRLPLTAARRSREFRYRCGCGDHWLGTTRHRRERERPGYLRCRRCRGMLTPLDEVRWRG